MTSIANNPQAVNYPSERYEIRYEPASGLFACLYGGEVFDRAANYGDGDLQCGYHWTAQQALEACPTRYAAAAHILRTYPDASYARWDDLCGGYAPLSTSYCVLTHKDGYGVHAVLPNGTLGALIERVRL